ncbi:MAG: PIN domain-containing protein [Bdellovibrionaceae bacterium]|nr:PIN domain-containing protein [Pseudobdellovibrionaceae bacterium]
MKQTPVATLDTNVLVSGLLNPFGNPGRIVDLVLARRLGLAYDDRLLMEYEAVLRRPRLGLPVRQVERFLSIFPFQQRVLAAPWPHAPSPDPPDTMFLEVATAAGQILVAGNVRHFPAKCRGGVRVMTPAEYLAEEWNSPSL